MPFPTFDRPSRPSATLDPYVRLLRDLFAVAPRAAAGAMTSAPAWSVRSGAGPIDCTTLFTATHGAPTDGTRTRNVLWQFGKSATLGTGAEQY